MKKLIVLIAVLLFIGTLPVYAEGPCPINYSLKIIAEETLPVLELEFVNTSILHISELKFEMDFHRADGTLLKKTAVVTVSNLDTAGYFTCDNRSYPIKSYPKLSYVTNLVCRKVLFADGSEWVNNKYSEPKAALRCISEAVNGAYRTENGILSFCDTSLNSGSQKWLFWNDSINGWTQFGDSVSAHLETDASYVTVKLEINGNPALYEIETVNIMRPDIAVVSYATDEVIRASRIFKFKVSDSAGPYMFGFWDYNDSMTSRKWFLWEDSSDSWQLISSERGPSFLLKSNLACLKLEYNGDPSNYRIIEISTIN